MSQQLVYIKDVTPGSSSWSVKVLVEYKGKPRVSMHNSIRYQRLTLVDEMGTKIVAAIFGSEIDKFERTLMAFDTYIISNAKVCDANPKYDNLGNKYTWTLSQRTVVTKVNDAVISQSIIVPKFQTFESLEPSDEKKTVDILAIVIKKYQQRTIESSARTYIIHEFAMLNDEKKPIILTLWNDVALSEGPLIMAAEESMPIISATKLAVSRHYGISIGSTSSTSIVIDPQIPAAHKLQKWRATNQDNIKEALLVIDRMIKMQQSSIQAGTKFHTIADVARAENADKFFLKLNIQIIETGQRFFYIACDNCHASYNAELNWSIDCRRCHETTVATLRERVMVNIFDNTGSLDATAFGEEAVKIINMNATLAMKMNNEGDTPSVERMNKTLKDKKFLVRLKKTVKVYQENKQTQYTILKVDEDKEKKATTPPSSAIRFVENVGIDISDGKMTAKKRLAFTDEDSIVESSAPAKKLKQVISEAEDEADPDRGSN